MILLNSVTEGVERVTAAVTAGNGSVIKDSSDVEVITGGSISGVVQDMFQNDVPSATVRLWKTTIVGSAYVNTGLYLSPDNPQLTNSNPASGTMGSYSFNRIKAGVYNLTVEKADADGHVHLAFVIITITAGNSLLDIAIPDYINVFSVGKKPIQVIPPLVMDGSHPNDGGIAGRVTNYNGTVGIANAYVAIVNPLNTSQAYYVGQTDSDGIYQFVQVSNTWNAATGTYEPSYRLYVNHSLYGDGYSGNFSVMEAATTGVDTLNTPLWAPRLPHAPGPAPGYPGRSIQYRSAPAMQGTQCPGAVYGWVTAYNTGSAIANAYVKIVNASNTDQAFYVTQTDARGFFLFMGINQTYDVAQGTYSQAYKLYSFDPRLGERYNSNFSIQSNATIKVNLLINPLPAHISISASRDYVIANDTDTVTISAYVTDALGKAVTGGTQITFTINSGGTYNYTNNGSFSATPAQTITVGTVNGYANADFRPGAWQTARAVASSSRPPSRETPPSAIRPPYICTIKTSPHRSPAPDLRRRKIRYWLLSPADERQRLCCRRDEG